MKNKKMTDAYKNAIGTVFLLAGAFFICSTFLSMRTVLADPIAPNAGTQSRVAPARAAARNARSTVARSTTNRATASRPASIRSTGATRSTAAASRNVSARGITTRNLNQNVVSTVAGTTASRSVSSRRDNATTRGTTARNNGRVVARTATAAPRVSMLGTGMRASTGINVSYLTNKLYTGNYSNIIDSTTGLISADAYSNCLESYYTCMDEICTARSDTKGRCSCAGRATNFLDAETALEKANEELIQLSGQLALLVATKGKDVSEAFKLTDAEKVMNCVSWKDMNEQYGSNSEEAQKWCASHGIYDGNGNGKNPCGKPDYCTNDAITEGFNLDNLNGSSSDILASLKTWADAKDLAKQYQNDEGNLISQYTNISGIVNGLTGITSTTVEDAQIDGLANKWGYELFEYAHNNVCGRVLDSCFNGIYEACGTPPSGTDSEGHKIGKCANGASTSCPYNYNSAIYVNSEGDVELNERGSTNSTTTSSASCFGYSTTTTTSGTTTTNDPYATLRGPVADARRSIMQKYLLDANAACDTYGTALKNTAQNINYQKIAAEQALRQKRMEFYNEEQDTILNDAITAASNFDECLGEILDCYESQSENTTYSGARWTDARIKTYCAQVSQVPHCYETMVCNPSTAQFRAVIDVADNASCFNSTDHSKNTCRNIVTLNEILHEISASPYNIEPNKTGSSVAMRERCMLDAGVGDLRSWGTSLISMDRLSLAEVREADENATAGYRKTNCDEDCVVITACNKGYRLQSNKCELTNLDCTSLKPNAKTAVMELGDNGKYGECTITECKEHYELEGNSCDPEVVECTSPDVGSGVGFSTWAGTDWGSCILTECKDTGYHVENNKCVKNQTE